VARYVRGSVRVPPYGGSHVVEVGLQRLWCVFIPSQLMHTHAHGCLHSCRTATTPRWHSIEKHPELIVIDDGLVVTTNTSMYVCRDCEWSVWSVECAL
jgi:hypothetical protein